MRWRLFALSGALAVLLGTGVWQAGCTERKENKKDKPVGTSDSSGTAGDLQASSALQRALEARRPPTFLSAGDEGHHIWKSVRRFYKLRGNNLAWIQKNRPKRQALELLDAVNDAAREGLEPGEYDVQSLSAIRTARTGWFPSRRSLDPTTVDDLDLRLTCLYMKYASHLVAGRVDPEGIDPHWFFNPRRVDLANLLNRSLETDSVRESLDGLMPQHSQYAALRDALARYRQLAGRGGWPSVPKTALGLKAGARNAAVAALQARLAATGDISALAVSRVPHTTRTSRDAAPAQGKQTTRRSRPAPGAVETPASEPVAVFDDATVEAVKRFQSRHGIKADGVVGKETLAALDVPFEDRIEQIELNLERWRWLPQELGDRHIVVNVPSYQLDAYEGNRAVLSMRVVVGKADSPTPIFADQMTTVVFSPHWNVPESIALNETLPAVLRDPGFLTRNNIEVVRGNQVIDPAMIDWSSAGEDFPYRFRQKPGTNNSLGLVKFLFPNQFNVYLHDTPADSLFARLERDFSHGCVRVEKPTELAQWVLRGKPEWTPERIEEAMHSGREQSVALADPIPVYLVYLTAWVSREGITHFYDDLYGHDARQRRMLPEARPGRQTTN